MNAKHWTIALDSNDDNNIDHKSATSDYKSSNDDTPG